MRASGRSPKISRRDQENLDSLKALGIDVDPATGEVKSADGVFEGSATPFDQDPDESIGPEVVSVSTTQTIMPLEQDDEYLDDEALPEETSAEQSQDTTPKVKQTEEGLEKREADARKAQAEMSKTQVKLEKTLGEVNKRFSDLEIQIQKLLALQTAVGSLPTALSPADEETVAQYRADFPEPVSVMEALVAPLHAAVVQLQNKLDTVLERESQKEGDKIFAEIYSKIPKSKVETVTGSDEFRDWLDTLTPATQRLYASILQDTVNYTPQDAIGIFKHYSRDTGCNLGLEDGNKASSNKTPQTPRMDAAPVIKPGSPLPVTHRTQQNEVSLENTPLSMQELTSFASLIQKAATENEREILRKRLNLSLSGIEIDGTRPTGLLI